MSTKAKIFLNDLKQSSLYASIGKVGEWGQNDIPPTDIDSDEMRFQDFNDSVFMKKILPAAISLGIRTIPWEERVFDQYDDTDPNLNEKDFYCVTESNNIYKCLSNNLGAVSTVEPSLTISQRFEAADGYIWKLVAAIPTSTDYLFDVQTLKPVKTLTAPATGYELQYESQTTAIPGTVDRLNVVQMGKRYNIGTTRLLIDGDGSGAIATPIIHAITGEITGVDLTENGSGYSYARVIIEDSSGIPGTGAIITATVSPLNGHGSDPEAELFASKVMINCGIENDENGFVPGDFSFRKVSIFSNPKPFPTHPLFVAPTSGIVHINPTTPFIFKIKHTEPSTTKCEVVIENGTDEYSFILIPDEADALFENTTNTVQSVSYANNEWVIDLGLLDVFTGSTNITVTLKNVGGSVIFSIPLLYEFTSNETVNNAAFNTISPEPVDDPVYQMFIDLELTSQSGTFESGEQLLFSNGGSATVMNQDGTTLRVSSPYYLITGAITGMKSGAQAIVQTHSMRKFPAQMGVIYSHYFEPHEKLSTDNVKLFPIFDFDK